MSINQLYQKNVPGITNLPRFVKLMNESIRKLELDLNGLVMLTEAASSNYICTPIIAALSGSEKVFAYTRDSKYGKAKDIISNTEKLAEIVGVRGKIEFIESLDTKIVEKADIVTNLGFLRPITNEFIAKMKETAVIPLMRETWEFREGEIDLKACYDKGVAVLGTNENHPQLMIFDYLGHLCAKKLYEMGIEILNSKIVVFGSGDFGLNIIKYLVKLGADVKAMCDDEDEVIESLGAEKIGNLINKDFKLESMLNADALIITTYPNNIEVIGEKGLISVEKLKTICPGVSVIQIKGNLDRNNVKKGKIPLLPKIAPNYGYMSWTLNELGPKAVLDLHTGGLKVGEVMARARLVKHSLDETIESVLDCTLLQDFSDEQKKRFVEEVA